MQQEERRYVVRELDDRTWSIMDLQTKQGYVLAILELNNFTIQLVLAEALKTTGSPRFLHFLAEIMSARLEVYDDETALRVARFVLSELEGQDIANPVTLARQLSADLHGQRVDWTPQKDLQ